MRQFSKRNEFFPRFQSRLRDIEEELQLERDVRFRQEKELTNLRLDFSELEMQLEEMANSRDREFENNKR